MGFRAKIIFALVFSVMLVSSTHTSFVYGSPSSHHNHPHVIDPYNPLTPEDVDKLLTYGIDEETAMLQLTILKNV